MIQHDIADAKLAEKIGLAAYWIGLAAIWYFFGFEWMVGAALFLMVHLLVSAETTSHIRTKGALQLSQAIGDKLAEQSEEIARLERMIESRLPKPYE